MIRKHFIVASYEWETFWSSRVTNGFPINCNTHFFIAV